MKIDEHTAEDNNAPNVGPLPAAIATIAVSYPDKFWRQIKPGDFIVYPYKSGSGGCETKVGLVVEHRVTERRGWVACITAEKYHRGNAWSVQNKGRTVPITNLSECVVVPASSVPKELRTMLTDARKNGGYGS